MRRHALTAGLVLLAIVTTILVRPAIHASGSLAEIAPLELGAAATPVGVTSRGGVSVNVDGYRVAAHEDAVVSVPVTLPAPYDGRTLLQVWAYGPPGVRTTAVLRAADGSERTLGQATNWVGRTFDVTAQARLGSVYLRVRGENSTNDPVLFFDRIAPVSAPHSLDVSAPAWSIALLVMLVAAALLALAGRLRPHWPLALLLAATAAVVWPDIASRAYEPLEGDGLATWTAATRASWLGFHDGVLWGSWRALSSFAVQVFHAFTPLVGTAPVSARTAALLTGLLALAAIYALGHRAAGRAGAAVAFLLGVAAIGFRDAVIAGAPLPALVLAGALFCYALHACLAQATSPALVMLGASAALLGLAEPAWLPGAVLVVVVVALVCGRPQRWRVAAGGLLAVVVCLLPHLASTASQNDGRMLANMDTRAVAARNIEFYDDGHGAPTPDEMSRDPLSGRPVGLGGYLFSDHSVSRFLGGAIAGAQKSATAFNATDRAGPLGILAFVIAVAGTLFVLFLPRLRLLVLLPPLVAAPTLFIAAQTHLDARAAGAVLWPAMLVSAVILVSAAARLARPLVEPQLSRFERLRARRRLPRPPRRPAAFPHRRRT